jgi:RHS repeat-associated protein
VGLVSEGGVLQRTYRYDPWGKVIADSDLTTGQTAPVDYNRFAGGFQDGADLYHFGMRYYDPRVGRWTQEDAIDRPSDLRQANRYLYAGADPINMFDASGQGIGDIIDKVTDVAYKAGEVAVVGGVTCLVAVNPASIGCAGVALGGAGVALSACTVQGFRKARTPRSIFGGKACFRKGQTGP